MRVVFLLSTVQVALMISLIIYPKRIAGHMTSWRINHNTNE